MTPPKMYPLPASWEECRQRGWHNLDILLVTGDAYVDHPSFGVALIGRLLESQGYRVAILAQPNYGSSADFEQFPAPLLFCGISGGNVDSIVANYSGNGKIRESDAYSPGGRPWRSDKKGKNNRFRPDRAILIYSNLAKAAFKQTPVILGGIEASLRRFAHYDYQQGKLRSSFLTDSKADLLVYGMGEKSIAEIAKRCRNGSPLTGLAGSCERLSEAQLLERYPDYADNADRFLILPSHQSVLADATMFLDAELALDRHSRAGSERIVLQKQQTHWVVQHPAAPLLTEQELDTLYELPYTRKPHPSTPDVPAYSMIQDSLTIVRGCSGNCSFCAITRHQGAAVISRSVESIVNECHKRASEKDFRGTISDLGGPTANLFATSCSIGSCRKRDCLYPKVCKHLRIDEKKFLELLKRVSSIEGVNNVFISSGLRMELLLQTPELLETILERHTPGAMKIAPEHSCDDILRLMHKEPHRLLERFIRHCRALNKKHRRNYQFIPYIISAHPGATEEHARQLVQDMHSLELTISKFQDFTPTPGTLSTAMYVSGRDKTTGKGIYVAKSTSERRRQRLIIEKRYHSTRSAKNTHGVKNRRKRKG